MRNIIATAATLIVLTWACKEPPSLSVSRCRYIALIDSGRDRGKKWLRRRQQTVAGELEDVVRISRPSVFSWLFMTFSCCDDPCTASMVAAFEKSSYRVAQPDCSSLQPAPCKTIPTLDDDGHVSYDEYEESCPDHICYAIRPVLRPVSNTSSMSMSMIRNQRYSEGFSGGSGAGQRHHAADRSPTAFTSIADSSEKAAFSMVYDSSAPWFCSVVNISFPARVEANTGYPPGKKEDMFAQCQYEQLLDSQTLGDCRHMRFSCSECALYYRYWLCAMAFPQCDPIKTVTNYPVYNASDPNSTGPNGLIPTKIFSILKPCRGICWAVVQRCQDYSNFNCPLSDMRDYGDYPLCNALGLDEGSAPIAKKIYW